MAQNRYKVVLVYSLRGGYRELGKVKVDLLNRPWHDRHNKAGTAQGIYMRKED